VVIGGGASGMVAAGRAAEMGANVVLLEKTNRPGNKLRLTGNRRGNLSNAMEMQDFISNFGDNGSFLYPAFQRFFRDDLLALLWRYGIETKTEADGRIFPVSDSAEDLAGALEQYVSDGGVDLRTNTQVTGILVSRRRVIGLKVGEKSVPAAAVVLATGGASYPETGSSGDGYRLAETAGHTIVKLRPALVPLMVQEAGLAKRLMGTTLRRARLTFRRCQATKTDPRVTAVSDQEPATVNKAAMGSYTGELLFTHFGLSGPIVLRASLAVVEALERGPVSVTVDLFPDLSDEQMRQRLQQEFDRYGKRGARHLMGGLVPAKMIDPLLDLSGLRPDRVGHQITADERDQMAKLLKRLQFNIKGALPVASAMVTAGGVSLKEIEPKTMASRLVKGLYFCGEVMDLAADTGGFNLQAAFSTGYVAGEEAAHSLGYGAEK
jgi:predicted Rossmann fold flavoprotein